MSSLLKHENRLTVLHFLAEAPTLGVGDTQPLPSKELVEAFAATGGGGAGRSTRRARAQERKSFIVGFAARRPRCVFCNRAAGRHARRPSSCSALVERPARSVRADVRPRPHHPEKMYFVGVLIRTYKRKATVYKMFENPEDCAYFKPTQLVTKHGLTCHMTCPIGTHGHFKVALSRPMSQADTVLLKLHKQGHPKFEGADDTDVWLRRWHV